MPIFSANIIPNTPAELRIFVSVLYQNIATLEKEINDLKAVQPDYTPVVRGTDGNIPIFGGNPNMQGMDKGLFLDDTYKVPTAVPAGGGFLYSNAGALTWKSPANQGITSEKLTSTIATGTAPLTVASTTKVTNLNADLLDGLSSASFLQSIALTTASNDVGGDVAMGTATTFYDGPSVSLAAGTWLIGGTITVEDNSGNVDWRVTAKLWDGSTVQSSAEMGSRGMGAGYNQLAISLWGIVAPTGTTTYKISATSTINNCNIKAAARDSGAGNNASHIRAIKVA